MALLTDTADALRDIRLGWQRREGWWALSRQAIKISYRRTTLGPIWITLQHLAFVLGISLLYSQLLDVKSTEMLPLTALGISFWGLLTGSITNAASTFTQQSQAILSSTFPMSFYVFAFVSQQLLTFFHSSIVLIPFLFLFGTSPNPFCLITVPASIGIVMINGFSLGLWLGPLSTRYRDISAAIPTVLQLALFLTPVFWSPNLLQESNWIIQYNPLAWSIETFRSPVLGEPVQYGLWVRLTVITIANLLVGIAVLSRTRNKISYWI
jgi:ABC-2 type transport system permease protein